MRQGSAHSKTLLALLACLLLLSGCAEKEYVKSPSPVRSVQTLQFEVNTNLDKEFLEQADLFAADVDKISDGRIAISIVRKPSEDLPSAEYDFAYMRNSQIAQLDPSLATLSLPFLYNDASHLSLALNSPEMMKILETRLEDDVFPLAALSSGNALLATTQAATQKEMDTPSYFQELAIGLYESVPEVKLAFQSLGTDVITFPKGVSLANKLGESINTLERPDVKINGVEVSREQILAMSTSSPVLYAVETMHDISPVWLTVKAETWAGFSGWEKAVIQEATAGLISGFEENRSRYRAAWEKEAVKKGITLLQPERQALTAMVYTSGSGSSAFQIPEYFDKKLFGMIQSYS